MMNFFQYQQLFAPTYIPPPAPFNGPDRWMLPFSDPVRAIPQNASGLFVPPDTTRFAEATSLDRWWRPLSEPVLRVPFKAESYFAPAYTPPPPPPPPMVDKWWKPFSDPVRAIPQVQQGISLQPFFFSETIFVSKWHQPFSTPVLRMPFKADSFFEPTTTPPPPVQVPPDRWWKPLSEPVRPIPQAAVGFFVKPDTVKFPETTTADRWWQPFSVPVRRIPEPQNVTGVIASPTMQPVPRMDRWYRDLDVPVLPLKRIIPPFMTGPERMIPGPPLVTTWFMPFREPVRLTPFIRQNFDPISWCQPPIIPIPPVPGKIVLTVQQRETLSFSMKPTYSAALSFVNTYTLTFKATNTFSCVLTVANTSTLALSEEPI